MEINSGSSTLPIPGDTRLLGQRPSNQGGAPVPFSVDELVNLIMGGTAGELKRQVLRVEEGFSGRPAAGKEKNGVWWRWEGGMMCSHAFEGHSGVPGGVNEIADHYHDKAWITNENGPGPGTAGERAQRIYSASPNGSSTLILHGYSPEIASTPLGGEHSIDTTAMTVGGGPDYAGTLKLRYTSNPGLTLNQVVIFQVTLPVAGIQASIFFASVTQAPTLVSGVYETLVRVTGLDANHWTPSSSANTTAYNDRWVLKTLAGEINGANKVSMARDATGPVEQLVVVWGTPHGLVINQSVSVLTTSALTGMTGFWPGFHSGYVAEIVSPTVAKIRIRNMRLIPNGYSYSGNVSSTTSTWAVVSGNIDPHHNINPATNSSAVYRDSLGRVTRWMGGGVDVSVDGEWACGTGIDPDSELRGRGGDVRMGRHSLKTMAGRAPRRGVRCIRNGSVTTPLATSPAIAIATTNGSSIGTGEFAVAIDALLEFGGAVIGGLADTACFFQVRLLSNGNVVLETWDGTTVTSTTVATALTYLRGTRAVLVINRGLSDIAVILNGITLYRGTPTSWGRSVSSIAAIRVGGASAAADRYNGAIFGAWGFAHTLGLSDIDFIVEHGRVPTGLQWATLTAYAAPFDSSADGWDALGSTMFGLAASANVDGIGGRNDCLELTTLSTTNTHSISKVLFARAKRFRIYLEVYRLSANEIATGIQIAPFNQGSTAVTVPIPGNTWTPITLDAEEQGIAGNSLALILYLTNAAGEVIFTGNTTDKFYIRNLVVQRLGAFAALDFSAGAGSQAADTTGNAFHSVLTTPFEHPVPERRFQIFQRVSLSGNNPSVPIPTNARIVSITANAAGSVTLSVGNVASGTQIVNAQALTTGIQDVTLAGRFSSTGNLVANLSSAVPVDITVECVITGP